MDSIEVLGAATHWLVERGWKVIHPGEPTSHGTGWIEAIFMQPEPERFAFLRACGAQSYRDVTKGDISRCVGSFIRRIREEIKKPEPVEDVAFDSSLGKRAIRKHARFSRSDYFIALPLALHGTVRMAVEPELTTSFHIRFLLVEGEKTNELALAVCPHREEPLVPPTPSELFVF